MRKTISTADDSLFRLLLAECEARRTYNRKCGHIIADALGLPDQDDRRKRIVSVATSGVDSWDAIRTRLEINVEG